MLSVLTRQIIIASSCLFERGIRVFFKSIILFSREKTTAHPIFVGSSVTRKCEIMNGAKGYTIVSDRHSLRIMHDRAARAPVDADRRFNSLLDSPSESSGEECEEEMRPYVSDSSLLALIAISSAAFISQSSSFHAGLHCEVIFISHSLLLFSVHVHASRTPAWPGHTLAVRVCFVG